MEVKVLKVEDLHKITDHAEEMRASSSFLKDIDKEFLFSYWTSLINLGVGEIYYLENDNEVIGALLALYLPSPLNGKLSANEYGWFVRKGFRGKGIKLLSFYEEKAKEKGCVSIDMAHMSDQSKVLPRLYERRGYIPVETHYRKVING